MDELNAMKKILTKANVRIKRPDDVKRKLTQIFADGPEKLQIISDFDHTISKSHCDDGERGLTTHALFSSELSKLTDLCKKYFPIELDEKMSEAEKIPHMIRWWNEAHQEIIAAGYDRSRMERLVANAQHLQLREGVAEFFRIAQSSDIPLIIFSAGIGDLIEMVLHHKLGRVDKNVHVISNRMTYNDAGTVIGFTEPLIHTFNKNSTVIRGETKFFQQLRNRSNVILMGDTLGDLRMDVGLECEQTVIKIGFLNQWVDALLPDYINGYDIVCVEDQTFEVPLQLVKRICDNNKTSTVAS